ncbi:MAG: Gfo/Idh/MocA family oxidoreductase [Lachnospiraceae bacterium]|nr:Gfo/Idh/MocA family oxidoreductase [Lachnospiraceae bacterium]
MKNIGIIGCGKIAQTRHIPEYADNENAILVGYYDFNMKRAEEIAKTYGGKAYESVDELLSNPDIDAVSVCTANNAHAEITLKALRAGKDVLCEKPMAITIEDCEFMVKTAEKKGKKLMIGQNQRLAKAHIKAKELIEQGAIGTIITFKTTFGHGGPETWSIDSGKNSWFFDKKRAAMGAMADLGVHKTDLIQFLTGQKVVETTAKVVTLDKKDMNGNLIGVDDNAICIYRMENGIIGTMTASWTYYGAEDNATILYGTKGIMRIYENPQYAIEIMTADGEKILYEIDKIQTNDNQTKSGIIDAFVEALEEDKEPLISGQSVLSAMRAVFASLESSEKGTTVHIADNK